MFQFQIYELQTMKPDPEFDPARRYQQEIRDSLLWVRRKEFGEEEAD
jgi:hypothetical protein